MGKCSDLLKDYRTLKKVVSIHYWSITIFSKWMLESQLLTFRPDWAKVNSWGSPKLWSKKRNVIGLAKLTIAETMTRTDPIMLDDFWTLSLSNSFSLMFRRVWWVLLSACWVYVTRSIPCPYLSIGADFIFITVPIAKSTITNNNAYNQT